MYDSGLTFQRSYECSYTIVCKIVLIYITDKLLYILRNRNWKERLWRIHWKWNFSKLKRTRRSEESPVARPPMSRKIASAYTDYFNNSVPNGTATTANTRQNDTLSVPLLYRPQLHRAIPPPTKRRKYTLTLTGMQ